MMRLALVPLLLVIAPPMATAADRVAELGDATVRYDDTRWRPLPSDRTVRFEPQGQAMDRIDPVELHLADGDTTCAALADFAFQFGHYELGSMTTASITVGGIPGERFEAHTGCRNATPRGVVICVKSAGNAYLLQSLHPGCTGNNLFSGIDPLAEIAAAISFRPRAP